MSAAHETSWRPWSRCNETEILVLVVWVAAATTYLITGLGGELSPDDAMRLVQVRDYLAGQSWFDLTQYRLHPPAGVVMHWSRLVDLPIAVLIRAGEVLLSPKEAERLALTVWPLSLMLLFFIAVAMLAFELAGQVGARIALLFAAISAPALQHFRPGAIDHHGAQIVLLIFSLALMVRGPLRPRDAAVAGVLCGLSMAVGLEMAPAIAALAGLLAIRWIALGDTIRQASISFGASFGLTTIALFAVQVPPQHYGVAECDTLSVVYAGISAAGGLGIAALSFLSPATTTRRLFGCAALAGGLIGFAVMARLQTCLLDPLSLNPRLAELWLSHVSEARNVISMMRDLPHEAIAVFALPLLALVLACVRSFRETDRWPWITCAAVLAVLAGITLLQIRNDAAANAVASALVPAGLVRMLPARQPVFLGLGRAALVPILLVNPLALMLFGQAAGRSADVVLARHHSKIISSGVGTCSRPLDYAALEMMPRGLVLAFIDSGPLILMQTPHSVLAAPYHRNTAGNLAMLEVMLGRPEEAVSRLRSLGVDYVAFCPGAPERYTYLAAAPASFAKALTRNQVPSDLERVDHDPSELKVYRLRAEGIAGPQLFR